MSKTPCEHRALPILLLLCGFSALSAAASADSLPSDFDGDGKTDFAVFHRAAGTPGLAYWNYLKSSDYPTSVSVQFGVSTDIPVPGDYDGDGLTDPAVYRPGNGPNGDWRILGSLEGLEVYTFGYNTDIPVPRDYTGDGETDRAVVRPGTGNLTWFLFDESINDYCVVYWGLSTDKLVPADYDGDGKAEVAVFRPSNGTWYILHQDCPATTPTPSPDYQAIAWGLSTDKPVPGDYDGDGKYDLAVFRPGDGIWYIRQSSQGGDLLSLEWGLSTDIPVPGDYDGDGKFDVAVFRPSTATWYVRKSSDGTTLSATFGDSSDTPVPAFYIP
jgi:hypothetical protein